MRLHPDTIAEVKQRVDIYDVVSEHVVLRKQGKDFVGLCPFHDDKSPSFSVSPSKQFYYCFSCGAGGNAIKFLMELGQQSFTDVVLALANRYQVPVKTLEVADREELQRQLSVQEQLYEILALAADFYAHALRQSTGQKALAYLLDKRSLTEETIQQFQLGYAPPGWSTLWGYLVEHKHKPAELVERAGLVVPRKTGDGYYDRFRDRLMIPIHDLQGRVIGFGGRALGDEQPKYLNSPETELFDKSKTLFGLDKARAMIAKRDQAIVVEGYFDVIALHAAGITNAVASLGTALNAGQVKQLLRYTESKQIVLNFDADKAGTTATERAISEVEHLVYQGQVQLRVLNLPNGKDPDEFLRQHTPEDYQQLLQEAPLWLDWQIQQVLLGRDLRQADQFQQAVGAIVKLLGNLTNASQRTYYIHRCAELLSQGEAHLALQLEADLRTQVRGQRWHGQGQKWERPGTTGLRDAAEAQLLMLYLHCPNHRLRWLDELKRRDLLEPGFGLSHHRFLWQQILASQQQLTGLDVTYYPGSGDIDWTPLLTIDLLDLLQDHYTNFPEEMAQLTHLLHPSETDVLVLSRPEQNLITAAASLERIACEKRCRHLLNVWREQGIKSVRDCLEQLLNQANTSESSGAIVPSSEDIEQLYHHLNADALKFQALYYDEVRYLQTLDRERQLSSTTYR
ncbi:MAG: DNA primase [Cyanobacteria bacterium]|nr:DNA primase [Cyanobacteriota bacterium]MDW8201189.1 DNA primase [Cyanobacteriota bacterium SKYGB_h_bin112]